MFSRRHGSATDIDRVQSGVSRINGRASRVKTQDRVDAVNLPWRELRQRAARRGHMQITEKLGPQGAVLDQRPIDKAGQGTLNPEGERPSREVPGRYVGHRVE